MNAVIGMFGSRDFEEDELGQAGVLFEAEAFGIMDNQDELGFAAEASVPDAGLGESAHPEQRASGKGNSHEVIGQIDALVGFDFISSPFQIPPAIFIAGLFLFWFNFLTSRDIHFMTRKI